PTRPPRVPHLPPQLRRAGKTPADERGAARWRRLARTVAAYRDRYNISDDAPLGPVPEAASQKIDRSRAAAALRRLAPPREEAQDPARRSPVGLDRQGPSL
ncbi:hypothetical protein, partial [Microbacterium sp.]|uniref:hypothetical protein n=2 Tax=Actinomycetes TaxID=1760 RepID=UPI003F9491A2